MAGMSKTQLVGQIAEKHGINKKTAAAFLEHLADLAIKETKKNGLFVLPGVGRLVVQAIEQRDYPLVQSVVFAVAALVILINLLVDLSYAWVDPRIRYS